MHVKISIDFAQLEIKDTINEVKYGCLQLLVEVFMRVMNGLVITLEKDEIFMCLAVLLYKQFFGFANEVPRHRSSQSYFMRSFFLSQCIQQQ